MFLIIVATKLVYLFVCFRGLRKQCALFRWTKTSMSTAIIVRYVLRAEGCRDKKCFKETYLPQAQAQRINCKENDNNVEQAFVHPLVGMEIISGFYFIYINNLPARSSVFSLFRKELMQYSYPLC